MRIGMEEVVLQRRLRRTNHSMPRRPNWPEESEYYTYCQEVAWKVAIVM